MYHQTIYPLGASKMIKYNKYTDIFGLHVYYIFVFTFRGSSLIPFVDRFLKKFPRSAVGVYRGTFAILKGPCVRIMFCYLI